MKNILPFILIVILVNCSDKTNEHFSLNGITSGLKDGTVVYLENNLENKVLDSAIIRDNKFSFNSKLPFSPFETILHTKDNSQYRFMWLENNAMTFNSTDKDFQHAEVEGSDTEDLSKALMQNIEGLSRKDRQIKEQEFIKENPKSIASAKILSVYKTLWGKTVTEDLYNVLSSDISNSAYGKNIANYLKLNKDPDIGKKFEDFTMTDQFGNQVKLSDIEGKLILLEFWASWCGPCRIENPNLVNTYSKFKSKGFEIFAVSLDKNKSQWLGAIKKDNLSWIHASDLKGSENDASLIYGINGIPANFLIDENGTIIARDLRGEELNEALEKLLDS